MKKMKRHGKSYKEYFIDYLIGFTASILIIAIFGIYFYNVFVKFQINYVKQHNQTIITKAYDFQNDLIIVSNSFFEDKVLNRFLNDKNELYSIEANNRISNLIRISTINSILREVSIVITKDNLIYSTLSRKKTDLESFSSQFPEYAKYIKNQSSGFNVYPIGKNRLLFSYNDYRGHIIYAVADELNLKNHLLSNTYPILHNIVLYDDNGRLIISNAGENPDISKEMQNEASSKVKYSKNHIIVKSTNSRYSVVSTIKLTDIWKEALNTGSFLMLLASVIFILICLLTFFFFFKQKKLISAHLNLLNKHINTSADHTIKKLFNCDVITREDEKTLNEYFQLGGYSYFLPVIIGIVNYNDLIKNIGFDDITLYKYGFENIISEVMTEIAVVKTSNMGKELIGILLYSEKSFDYNTVRTKIKYFENVILKNFQTELFSVIGEETEDIVSTFEQIPLLINAQNYKFINNENEILISEVSKAAPQVDYPYFIQTEIITNINSKNQKAFATSLAKFSDYIIKNNSLNAKEWFIRLFLSISENCHNNPDISITYNTLEAMTNCDRISEMTDMLFRSIKYLNISPKKVTAGVEEEFDQIVINAIEEEFSNPDFSIQSITERFGFTASYFGKKFKHRFNTSFNNYLLDYRLQYAIKLLFETNYTNTKIAKMCGFNSENYFITIFKKKMGLSPKEYKSKNHI